MNEKTSINSIYHNMWAPTAGLSQGLTVMQQCVQRHMSLNWQNAAAMETDILLLQARNCETIFQFIWDKPTLTLNSLSSWLQYQYVFLFYCWNNGIYCHKLLYLLFSGFLTYLLTYKLCFYSCQTMMMMMMMMWILLTLMTRWNQVINCQVFCNTLPVVQSVARYHPTGV